MRAMSRTALRPGTGDDAGDLGGVVAAAFVVDVLDDQAGSDSMSMSMPGGPARGAAMTALEQQLVGHRVDGGDAQGIAGTRSWPPIPC